MPTLPTQSKQRCWKYFLTDDELANSSRNGLITAQQILTAHSKLSFDLYKPTESRTLQVFCVHTHDLASGHPFWSGQFKVE